MKKQVLVSVDRGETRVALLEATGTVPARKPAPGHRAGAVSRPPAARLQGRRALPRAPRHPLDRRQHLQGARRQRPRRARGRVRRHRAGEERLPARRRDRAAGRRGARAAAAAAAATARKITDMLKPGQEIVVQVVKDPLKTKGARLSMDLTIAGRYMVYAPYGEGVGVSRRLDDKERERLRKEAAKLELKGAGAIIRTAAQGAKRADLERELVYLFKLGEVLQKRVAETPGAGARLPGGRPLGARRARHLLGRLRARDRRRPQAAPPAGLVLLPDRARARRARRAVGGGRSRCSRPSGSSRCSTRRSRAASTCPAAAT